MYQHKEQDFPRHSNLLALQLSCKEFFLIIGENGRNYGLLQLSDKYNDADFTEEDEAQLKQLARLTTRTLGPLRRLHENSAPGHEQ
jgi:hypothetical protein